MPNIRKISVDNLCVDLCIAPISPLGPSRIVFKSRRRKYSETNEKAVWNRIMTRSALLLLVTPKNNDNLRYKAS